MKKSSFSFLRARHGFLGAALSWSLAMLATIGSAAEGSLDQPERKVDGIMDNSFLLEEAYNQEAGVVQHIFTMWYAVDRLRGSDDEAISASFTQEWPLFSQTHQVSYTLPYNWVRQAGEWDDGLSDISLNYRYQAYFDPASLMAFAPRVSLVLPTGDEGRGFGRNSLGYQLNLPFSTAIGDSWFFHANAGLSFFSDAGANPESDLLDYNFGASVIYALTHEWHLMLEWIGNWNEVPGGRRGTDREFLTLISPGVRKAFNLANDAQLVLGVAAPIGLNSSAPDYGVFVYASFEHFFTRPK